MPVVIDLLSSPELAQPARTTKKANGGAATNLPSKALNYEGLKANNDDWFTLSSDEPDIDNFLPPPKPIPKSSVINALKPSSSINTSTKPPQPTNMSKPSNDFFYLSDDFDSTVNLDEPFASDLPPTKKRRISPPLDPFVIARSPEYQRWIKKLEKSTSAGSNVGSSEVNKPAALGYKTSAADIGTSSKPAAPRTMVSADSFKATATSTSTYKRPVSDMAASSKSTAPKKTAGGLKRSKTMGAVVESDPIIFTSSPDPVASARKRKDKSKQSGVRGRVNELLAFSSDDSDFDLYARKKKGKNKPTGSFEKTSGHGAALRDYEFDYSDVDLPDIGAISQSQAKKNSKDKSVAMTALDRYEAEKAKENKERQKEQKAKEKDEKARDKVTAREAEKEQKLLAKEERAREKDRAAELAKVNILRTDKKKSTLEMIVDLPDCLNSRLMEQIQKFLKPVEAEHSVYESSQPIIKWRRMIDSEYDEEAGHWDTVKSYIGTEKHVMCIMTAKEFVDLAIAGEGKDLDTHVLRLKAKFSTNDIIYLLEGLEPFMRKNKNAQNRKYVQEVRSQIPQESAGPTTSQKRKKQLEPEHIDEDLIEDALLKLQVMHGVLIHHTKVAIETAEWVIVFTQHISTIRYRAPQQALDTAFCMESGQVKTGDGPADTYVKMLQEMVRITAPIAYGIAAEYPSVQKLVQGFRKKGQSALQDCRKTANKDGAFTDKKVGPSISKRLYTVFMSRDPGSWDV